MKNKVSIGIPFYNSEEYLDFAIRSVLNQTYQNWELVLIDDGSTDNSICIAEKYVEDPRIKLYVDGNNKGLSSRLNEISLIANGDYIARMDADDIMHPDRIQTQLDFLIQNPAVDVVGSAAYSIDKYNKPYGYRASYNHSHKRVNALNGCFIHPTIVGKKLWFLSNPYNREKSRMEDFELWNRTIAYSNFSNLKQPLLFYREIGMPYSKKYAKTGINICKYILKGYPNEISLSHKYFFVGKIICKIGLYFFMDRLNKLDSLIQKRSERLSHEAASHASVVLNTAIL